MSGFERNNSRAASENSVVNSSPTGFISATTGKLALLVFLILLVYWPAVKGGYALDDEYMITQSPVISAPDGLYRIWCTTEEPDYWPLTYTTFWLEHRLWGNDPLGYHAVNVVLHIISVLLIWVILSKLSIPGAFLAALLFAIHPVNVESIAWIAQRKNALAMVFFLLSILWYLEGEDAREPSESVANRAGQLAPRGQAALAQSLFNRWYWLSLVAFVLALLSKGSVAILPAILLGVVWWRRPISKRDLVRLVPFFVVAAIFVGINIWFQAHANVGHIREATFAQRLLGAGGVIWFYLYKALWPFDLAFIYPQWHFDAANPWWWLPLFAAIATTMVLFWQRHRPWVRATLFVWGFFCVSLLPVMGLTDVGFMRFSLVADHYQHIAIIGVVTLVATAICTWREPVQGIGRDMINAGLVTVVAGLSLLTWQQCGMYRDTITLYQTALEKNPDLWMLHGNLGDALFDAGRIQEAIPELREALRLYPESDDAHFYLARSLAKNRQWNEAIEHYEQTIRIRPDFMQANRELADLYVALGRQQEAIATAEKALAYAQSVGNSTLQRQIESWISARRAGITKPPGSVDQPHVSRP